MKRTILTFSILGLIFASCSNDDDAVVTPPPTLTIPTTYTSANFNTNAATEIGVVADLNALTSLTNAAESDAQMNTVNAIAFPSSVQSVTLSSYATLMQGWLVEIVNAANSTDGFQNPGLGGTPAVGQEGGLLGDRLLDENGLELEQMLQKGVFGAGLYNHAITVVNNIKNGVSGFTDSGAVDRLVAIFGATPAFDAASDEASQYAERRSNHTNQTGFFYDIQLNLRTAQAAMEAGSTFDTERNAALDEFLMNWEKSNYATVIFYCRATINLLNEASLLAPGETNSDGETKEEILGDAMHAYAEGVAFAHGFRGISNKIITDSEIDGILAALLAPAGQTPTSFEFLNVTDYETTLSQVEQNIQAIYGFTNDEVSDFYTNNNL
ncbi:MAG: hypothetical protein AAF611_00320 [Bacteroidota bacterium]